MLRATLKKFLPIFGLALVLPFMLTLISKPDTLTFLTRAENELKLNVWLTPSRIIASTTQPVEVDLMASFESEVTPLNYLKVDLPVVGGVIFRPDFFVYEKPFRGTVKIGTLNLSPLAAGNYEITIPVENVVLTVGGKVDVKTGSLNLVVK
ncbi:MAG: hypothetical protein ACD_52C00209G0010 [uncultured bacterium]|uniref:Uncharacterized protein n=1 Tax=Candidatus Woesebacteria bacterium RIFCSPHIGHO2_12_FULL_41_24 TaxID=1802510 RepID=A0A1F8AVR0_9BACT|nr:MAG: hypothetical protein ACD_52C00209G0010 [uncultured bacterium]OGM14343.1 MAG: hypothetical protein A2W15_02230 [Candidatus Woesebacteria bacterium RBG_16_41_13]OGM30466.1 MAG: hypothetical protein A2873_02050 [Candidatus Woesebacteria bacterium RIFCSPHIGHO2_01_FULL_42_80]OGM34218.1 MAG: hypothetical protein A3D84_04370 [Candidatus Woesebacteria bacterium RIFCSPHIGHO2_02_FULL_42_20]OGM55325.1 MAG: hypothetical protein A3E44_03525 [Candidatus Woesebacteria bacterium RIFCSPHIGHO2_12_FULL_41